MVRQSENIEFPNRARVAVTFMFCLEAWTEGVVPKAGPITPLQGNLKDNFTINWAEYGGNSGIWNLMDLFDRFGFKATAIVSGVAAERYPEAVRALAERGHEVAAHSYAQDILSCALNLDEERENIRKSTEILERVTGERPRGWISPRFTPSDNTVRLLAEEGYLWHGDCADFDVPYVIAVDGQKIIGIPHVNEANDIDNVLARGNDPSVYVRYYKNTFDYLYREGDTRPRVINATAHAHIFGRPHGLAALERVLHYAKGFSSVWNPRRIDVARWWLQNYA